jgi:hypothetical protein
MLGLEYGLRLVGSHVKELAAAELAVQIAAALLGVEGFAAKLQA